MNPRSRDERKIILRVFKKICFKDNNTPKRWVGHLKLRCLEIYDFFKITPKFDGKQASVTGDTPKKNTDDADETEEENETRRII